MLGDLLGGGGGGGQGGGGGGGGLVGSLVGGTLGAIGNYLQAKQLKKNLSKMRKQVRQGIESAERATAGSVLGTMSTPEWLTARNFIRSFYGISAAKNEAADVLQRVKTEFGGGEVGKKGLEGLQVGESQINAALGQAGRFASPIDVLSEDFTKGLRQAQALRGLTYSEASAAGEASGMAAFRSKMQMQMLPYLFQVAEAPAALRAKYEGGHLAREVFYKTGGAVAFGQPNIALGLPPSTAGAALAGAAQGAAGGASMGLGLERILQSQQSQPAGATVKEDPYKTQYDYSSHSYGV